MSAVLDDNVGFDEPAAQAPEATAAATRNVLAIQQDMGRVQNALGEFDRVSAGLAELEARFPKDAVYDVTSTKGMKDAIEHRAAWRDPRIMVEKARKMAKAPLLALGKNVDARAAWLTERLREGEEPIDQLIKAEEQRKEDERQARINAEAGRVLAIQEALAGIGLDVQIACTKTSADIQALLDTMRTTAPDPLVFQEQVEQARAAWAAGITKLETAHKAKLWEEEQEAKRAAAEAERKRVQEAEDAERARVSAAQAAEAQRLALLAGLTKHVTDCFGKTADFISLRIDMLAHHVYSEGVAAEALTAHEAALQQLRTMHAMAVQQEAMAAQAAAQARIEAPPVAPVAVGSQDSNGGTVDIATAKAGQEPNTPPQGSQQVLKATAETPDATDRDTPAISSPSVGSMGVGQPADAGPAGDDRPIETSEAGAVDASTQLLRDTLTLVEFLRAPYSGKFPTQPKVGTEWWASLRTQLDAIEPRLHEALGIQAGEA